jgi:hypothetical protein
MSIVIAVGGAMASAFFVHTHNYPGRMTIHLVPFAVAAFTLAASAALAVLLPRRVRAPLHHIAEVR